MPLLDFSWSDWIGASARTIPTTDLYFLNAVRHLLAHSFIGRRGLRREGANAFSCNGTVVISRRDRDDVVNRLLRRSPERLVYIIDDDLWAAENDETLPADYRNRLVGLREGQQRLITDKADLIVVSSPVLGDIYRQRGHEVAHLDPYWSEPLADESHFSPLDGGAPFEVGYLGSASHAIDRTFVLNLFEAFIVQMPNMRLTIVGQSEVPDYLVGHPNLRVLPPLPWRRHRRRLAGLRFHALLYPTLPTTFNTARSLNKVIEHAVLGGAGIYSDDWQYAGRVKELAAGLTAPGDLDAWAEAIREVARAPRELHRACRLAAEKMNAKEAQVAFWKDQLPL